MFNEGAGLKFSVACLMAVLLSSLCCVVRILYEFYIHEICGERGWVEVSALLPDTERGSRDLERHPK